MGSSCRCSPPLSFEGRWAAHYFFPRSCTECALGGRKYIRAFGDQMLTNLGPFWANYNATRKVVNLPQIPVPPPEHLSTSD